MTEGPAAIDVLAAVRSAVVVVAADGGVEHVNPAAERLLGRPLAGVVGVDLHALVHGRDSGCHLRDVLASGGAGDAGSDTFRQANGASLPVSWTVDPMAGGRVVLTVSDVSVRERDLAALWEAQRSVSDLGWIAELTRAMSSTMDEQEALLRLARLMTPRLADIALVDSLDAVGELTRVGGSVAPGVDIDLEALLAGPDVTHVPGPAGRATRRVAASGTVVRMDAAQMADPDVVSEASRILLAGIGARSMLVVPLAARNRVGGVTGLIRLTDDAYTDEDVLLAADIGRRAGLVLDNARLYREQERTAEDLQRALLPEVRDTGRLRVAARYLPASDRLRVGGDWYDLFTCPDDDSAHVLVIGDVAGHDLAAATAMAAVRNLLRGIAVSGGTGPADVLTAVDTALPALGIEGTATCLVVRARPSAGGWTLTWSNAGHPPAVLVPPHGETQLLDTLVDPLLGTRIDPTRRERSVEVPTGTVVLLYTDGLVERRTEDLDRGFARLRLAASQLGDDLQVDDVIATVLDRMAAVHEDDTAVIAVRLD